MEPRHTRPTIGHPARERAGHRWSRRPRPATAAVAVVGVALTLLTGGAAQATPPAADVDRDVAAVDARLSELAERNRSSRAQVARLNDAAVRYAAVRRAQALAAARTAVESAQAVVARSGAEVPAETLTPLEGATAQLVALVAATPASPSVAAVGDAAAVEAVAVTAAPDGGTAPTATPGPAPATAGPAPASPGPATPGPATPAPVAPEPVTRQPVTPEPATPAATTPDTPGTAEAGTGAAAVAQDLAASETVLAAAERVTDLSAEVQAAAEAAAAAAAAARAAAEEAARVAAEELARKVDAVAEAPNGEIPLDVLCQVGDDPDDLLRCDAVAAFELLAAAYRADAGEDLEVVSTYRSFADQVAVKAAKGGLAATPGRSNHGRGLAVDLGGFGGVGQFTAPAYLWMKENAEAFGWYHPAAMEPGGSGPQEPWHWEFGVLDPSGAQQPPVDRRRASTVADG